MREEINNTVFDTEDDYMDWAIIYQVTHVEVKKRTPLC